MNEYANEAAESAPDTAAADGEPRLCSTAQPPAAFSLTGPALKPASAYFKALLGILQPRHHTAKQTEGKTMQLFLQIQRCSFFILIAAAANTAKKS